MTKVLIIDQVNDIQQLIREIEENDSQVTRIDGLAPEDAADLSTQYDLVLVGLGAGSRSNLEIIRAISRLNPSLPVFALSNSDRSGIDVSTAARV